MTIEEKIRYYIDKFKKEVLKEDVSDFLNDISVCTYRGEMFCPLCSAGCYKINVMQNLPEDKLHELNEMMFKIRYIDKKCETY